MHNKLKKMLITAVLMAASMPTFAGVVVIMSAKSGVSHVSKSDVGALYLGRTSNLPNGSKAHLYDLAESSAVRKAFYSKATGKSTSQVKATWSRLVFSGRAVPPKELSSAAAVVKAVAADTSAIGYVDSGAVNATVKVVAKLP